jgi:hypothetical protein
VSQIRPKSLFETRFFLSAAATTYSADSYAFRIGRNCPPKGRTRSQRRASIPRILIESTGAVVRNIWEFIGVFAICCILLQSQFKLARLLLLMQKEIVEPQMSSEEINDNLKSLISLCGQMLDLADRGDAERTDAGCGVVYGTLRDTAYKMRQMAKVELQKHISNIAEK